MLSHGLTCVVAFYIFMCKCGVCSVLGWVRLAVEDRVFLSCAPHYSLRHGLSAEPELGTTPRPACQCTLQIRVSGL